MIKKNNFLIISAIFSVLCLISCNQGVITAATFTSGSTTTTIGASTTNLGNTTTSDFMTTTTLIVSITTIVAATTTTTLKKTWVEKTVVGHMNTMKASYWTGVASSSDGAVLAACEDFGYIYTSKDNGASWKLRSGSGNRRWSGITSSSDGTKLAACVQNRLHLHFLGWRSNLD